MRYVLMILLCAGWVGGVRGGDVRVLALGDSLTAGYGLEPDFAFPAVLQELAREAGYAVMVRNAGLSGETSAGGVRRLEWVLRQRVDVLLLSLGANDALRGIDPATTRENLRTMILRARELQPGILIILGGMRAPPNLGSAYAEAFDAIFPDLAEELDTGLIPFLLEGVAGDPALNQADGIHPTAEGQQRIARLVWRELERVLAARGEEAQESSEPRS
ncbi:MAG: arylesterase [Opitutales bacterium]|nr:arylesterase [Opitutales bacterium]